MFPLQYERLLFLQYHNHLKVVCATSSKAQSTYMLLRQHRLSDTALHKVTYQMLMSSLECCICQAAGNTLHRLVMSFTEHCMALFHRTSAWVEKEEKEK